MRYYLTIFLIRIAQAIDWVLECTYLVWKGWRPIRVKLNQTAPASVGKVWRWEILDGDVIYRWTRHNAWVKARDRSHELIEIRLQLHRRTELLAKARAVLVELDWPKAEKMAGLIRAELSETKAAK